MRTKASQAVIVEPASEGKRPFTLGRVREALENRHKVIWLGGESTEVKDLSPWVLVASEAHGIQAALSDFQIAVEYRLSERSENGGSESRLEENRQRISVFIDGYDSNGYVRIDAFKAVNTILRNSGHHVGISLNYVTGTFSYETSWGTLDELVIVKLPEDALINLAYVPFLGLEGVERVKQIIHEARLPVAITKDAHYEGLQSGPGGAIDLPATAEWCEQNHIQRLQY